MSVYFEQNGSDSTFKTSDSWTILSNIEQSIKRKIESAGVPLKDWNIQINYGIKTGFNDAFIISGAKKDELIATDPKSAEIIRPILRGRDIKRYGYNFADLWLICTFPSKHYDINNYPAVRDYLLGFGIERLEQTGKKYVINGQEIKARKKTNNKWFETQDSISYWDDFYKPKIIWGNLCLSSQFAFADDKYFINAPATMIVPGNFYVLAVLNSKLADWYIRQLGVARNGGYFEYKPMFVEKMPIPQENHDLIEKLTELAKEEIELKNQELDSTKIDDQINNLVFDLFNLTIEEKNYFNE